MSRWREQRIGTFLAKDDGPVLRLTKVLHDLLEHGEVVIMRTNGEFGEGDSGIANVGMAGNVGVKEFTKESPVGKSMAFRDFGMFWRTFSGAGMFVDGFDGFGRDRSSMFGW